jgi:hypothetical protein
VTDKPDPRAIGYGTPLLIAGVFLVAAVCVIALVPMAACPECEGGAVAVVTKIELPNGGDEIAGCTTCNDKTKATLLKKWFYRRD